MHEREVHRKHVQSMLRMEQMSIQEGEGQWEKRKMLRK